MIPDLPEGISPIDALKFYDTLSGNMSDQSTIHVHWWTHRQNPSVCWICDYPILISKILDLTQQILSKSTVDIRTDKSQEEDSDSEIESLNKNEELQGSIEFDESDPYNEPEYDVVDDDMEPDQREQN